MDQRLRRGERLTHRREFDRVYARRCRVVGEWLVLAGCENGLPRARLGLAVGRRWGKAHERVRLKRWYREAFRLEKKELPPGVDYLLMPRKVAGLSLAHLRQELPALAARLADRLRRNPPKVQSDEPSSPAD